MSILNEVKLAKELIKFPSITPVDAGVMKFLEKKLKKLGFKTKIIEFKEKNFKPVKNLYARLGKIEPNFCLECYSCFNFVLVTLRKHFWLSKAKQYKTNRTRLSRRIDFKGCRS